MAAFPNRIRDQDLNETDSRMSVAGINAHPARTLPALAAFAALIVALIIGQVWWASAQDRRLSIEAEKANALVTVRGLEEHASQILHGADNAIDATVKALQVAGDGILADPPRLQRILARELQDTAYLQSIRYIDLHGISRVTSFAQPIGPIDVSDREYIQFLDTHPQRKESAIGRPVRSRYDDQWIVPIARNLFSARGERIGLIGAYIRVPYFEDFYRRLAKDNHAIVSLYSDRGFVLIHPPFVERLIGIGQSAAPVMRRIWSGATEGSFEESAAFENKHAYLFTYRKFKDFPVAAIYARDLRDVLAPSNQRASERMLFAGTALGLVLALAALLAIQIRRLQQSTARLAASEDQYRLLFEGAHDAILLWNLDQRYVDCNQAAVTLFGVPDKQHIIGHRVGDFSAPEQPATTSTPQSRQRHIDAALQGEPQHFEWTILRLGELRHSDVTLSRAKINNELLMLAVFTDISARKHAQALQSGQNRILHMIAAGQELNDILTEIVLFLQQHAPHARGAILLLNEAQTHFSYVIAPSIQQSAAAIAGMPVALGNGCCSETVLSRCPVIIENFAESPTMAGLLQRTGPLAFASSGAWPIMGKRGQILAALSLLYSETHVPDATDMQLVGISTDLAGIAIESRKAEERILHLAHYDELTDLPNRFLFIQHLDKALAHAERKKSKIAVLFLDLDRFKNINDTFGHETGDRVLRASAARMRQSLREQDTIARVGGDEFLALVDDYHDPRKLGEIAQRLLTEAAMPFDINNQEYQLSVSIGIATYPDDGLDAQTLLKNADIAMYRAKTTGKNHYQFYSAEMNTYGVERAALEARLRKAIEQRELVVHYQPKVDVESGRIVGAEALVRWRHPERGLLLPGEFIPLAEEAGLISALGMQVLDIACRDVAGFEQSGQVFGRIAINLSAAQFNQADLLRHISQTVAAWQVSSSSLEFEITESMVMHNREQAIRLMNGIRDLGCTLSIDDFGTGYSSLAYLKRFPVNSVKIDKSFINDIPHGPNDSAIVQAIIAMAHSLGLEVTAEGVETGIQLQTLQEFGCDRFQGFYFSKAVPAAEFMALIKNQSPGVSVSGNRSLA